MEWAEERLLTSESRKIEPLIRGDSQSAALGQRRPVRATAASHILTELRRLILDVALPPGMPLSEKDLTERFGVSRTPVREALIRLAEERLVDIFPQSGTFVGLIPYAELPEAVIIRKALEAQALDLAMNSITPSGFEELDHIIARQEAMAALQDNDGFHQADEAFHGAIAAVAGHPGLWRFAQQSKIQIDRCRRLTLPRPGRMGHVIEEHRCIVRAMRTGNRQAAQEALTAHLTVVLPDAEALRQHYPSYFS